MRCSAAAIAVGGMMRHDLRLAEVRAHRLGHDVRQRRILAGVEVDDEQPLAPVQLARGEQRRRRSDAEHAQDHDRHDGDREAPDRDRAASEPCAAT